MSEQMNNLFHAQHCLSWIFVDCVWTQRRTADPRQVPFLVMHTCTCHAVCHMLNSSSVGIMIAGLAKHNIDACAKQLVCSNGKPDMPLPLSDPFGRSCDCFLFLDAAPMGAVQTSSGHRETSQSNVTSYSNNILNLDYQGETYCQTWYPYLDRNTGLVKARVRRSSHATFTPLTPWVPPSLCPPPLFCP